jgi:hypothetical protein
MLSRQGLLLLLSHWYTLVLLLSGVLLTLASPVAALNDLDGDGKADLAWRHTSGQVGVWLLNGTTLTQGALVGEPVDLNWHVQ